MGVELAYATAKKGSLTRLPFLALYFGLISTFLLGLLIVVAGFPATFRAIKYLVYTEFLDQEKFSLTWRLLVTQGFMVLFLMFYPAYLIWGLVRGRRRAWWGALAFLIAMHISALLIDVDGLVNFNRLVFGFDEIRFLRFLLQFSIFVIYPFFHNLILNRFEIEMAYFRANILKLIIKVAVNLVLFFIWLNLIIKVGILAGSVSLGPG